MGGFLTVLLRLSLFGTLSAILLILLQPVLRRLAGWTAVYYLWLAVLLRLCIPAGITIALPGQGDVFSRLAETDAVSQAGSGHDIQNEISPAADKSNAVHKSGEDGILYNLDKINSLNQLRQTDPKEASTPKAPAAILSEANLHKIQEISGKIPWPALWGIGACVYLGWHIWAFMRFSHRVHRSLSAAPPEASAALRGLEPEGRVLLMESDILHTPMLLGLRHPMIVLPAGMGENSAQTLKDILAHELVHEKRKDLVYKWFIIIAAGLHWFNPLMFLVRREIGRCCELSCDEMVIRGMDSSERRHYGETLLAVAGGPLSGTGTFTASLCEEKVRLKERLVSIGKYRKKGLSAVFLSVIPILTVAGCAMISGTGRYGSDREAAFTKSPDESQNTGNMGQSDGDPKNTQGQDAGTKNTQSQGSGMENAQGQSSVEETAAETYLAVLTGKKQFLYYAEDNDKAQPMGIADVPAFFSPDSSYAKIDEFAAADLDGEGEPEILLHVTDVAGDMGGFLILRRQDGAVHGYSAHYKAVSSLKTDGTFVFMSLAKPDSGIGKMQFHENGYTIIPLACSKTEDDNHTTVYLAGQKQISEEDYLTEIEKHNEKSDVVWYEFTDEAIQAVLSTYGSQTGNQKKEENVSEKPLNGTGDSQADAGSVDNGQELYYEKDGMWYELVKDLITGRYDWASVLSAGKPVKDSHGHERTDYYSQERRFERLDGKNGEPKESYIVRRWDDLLYSAGEYLIFEYDGMIHVSKSTDLYHPVLSYKHGGTYGIVTKVPHGYMIADERAYEIRFYDEKFVQTQVVTGLRAGESGNYYQDGLMAVRDMQTGLSGFMNEQGKIVIPCRYASVSDFSNGYASVLVDAETVPYTEDAGTVQLFYGKGGQWGIIDQKGRFVLEPSAEYANESPDDTDEVYVSGIRRFGPMREDGTVDFIAQDQNERVLKTISIKK